MGALSVWLLGRLSVGRGAGEAGQEWGVEGREGGGRNEYMEGGKNGKVGGREET